MLASAFAHKGVAHHKANKVELLQWLELTLCPDDLFGNGEVNGILESVQFPCSVEGRLCREPCQLFCKCLLSQHLTEPCSIQDFYHAWAALQEVEDVPLIIKGTSSTPCKAAQA